MNHTDRKATIERIAQEHLSHTTETRNSDSLDFFTTSAASAGAALEAAREAGYDEAIEDARAIQAAGLDRANPNTADRGETTTTLQLYEQATAEADRYQTKALAHRRHSVKARSAERRADRAEEAAAILLASLDPETYRKDTGETAPTQAAARATARALLAQNAQR